MSSTTEKAAQTVSDLAGKAQTAASDLAGRAQSAATTAASKAQEVASNVAGKASDVAHNVAHNVGTHPLTDTTAKIPTEAFIMAAGASIAGSLVLKLLGRDKDAEFVGQWAPTLISLGLLSKLIEHARSNNGTTDRTPRGENL